jgi:hypothetical protein
VLGPIGDDENHDYILEQLANARVDSLFEVV